MPWADMHCHLDLMDNAEFIAAQAAERGLDIFDATVTPEHALSDATSLAEYQNVHVACGLHPWWITDDLNEAILAQLKLQARNARFIGEVGLDFSAAHQRFQTQQVLVFEALLATCSTHPMPERVLSIHAVQSVTTVLDLLERYGTCSHATCIMHWFSGTSDELTRARKMGCYFSVSEHMLKSKRGRAYAQAIEADRLLLETDYPPNPPALSSAQELIDSLSRTLEILASLRHESQQQLEELTWCNSERLLRA